MARVRFILAYGALALAVALLVPAFAPLSGSMDAFADDLANGTFRPFGLPGGASARAFTGNLGGLTGSSAGNYLPGGNELPSKWIMDRDGRGGNVVIDYVFDPALGAMKRLKSFDKLGDDGETLEVRDPVPRFLTADAALDYDRRITGSFTVQFRAGEPIPIFSVHPKAVVDRYTTDPPVPGGVQFLRDGADTIYAVADHDGLATLNLTYRAASDYYALPLTPARTSDYPLALRPVVPANVTRDAQVVLARAGVEDATDVTEVLTKLTTYFRAFEEGPLPDADEVESLYLALGVGGTGCCRHRAFAFMATAQAVGIPARVIVNEAHAFVEVARPNGHWHQINLGGCGTYTINNPDDRQSFFDQAQDPRGEANPGENQPATLVRSFTNITDSPPRVEKGETYIVAGTVEAPNGQGVPGAIVDVFLNETKDTPGRRAGAGRTDANGNFAVEAQVPPELPAQSYQLVARSSNGAIGNARFEESWSDPPIDVFTPTRFAFPQLRAAVGFPANVSGRLLDVDDNPVRGARVDWETGGATQPPVITDLRGGFTVRVNFTSVGEGVVRFDYGGDAHHGPSTANASIRVERGAILLPPETPRLVRGHESTLEGRIAVAGASLANHAINVAVHAPGSSVPTLIAGAQTGSDGRFTVFVTPTATLPTGAYDATYEVPSLGLSTTAAVLLNARPVLDIEAPAEVSPGDALDIVATLASDEGRPLVGATLALHVDGNATPYRRVVTDGGGVARFTVAADTFPGGDHAFEVRYDGSEHHAPVIAERIIHLAQPWYALIPPWGYALLAAMLLLAPPLAWLLRKDGALRARIVAARASRAPRRRVEITFPSFPGIMPASEPGGHVRVAVGIRDRDNNHLPGAVILVAPHARRKGRARMEHDATFDLDTPDAGTLHLHARARGLARLWTRPADVALPVISWREAVERGFVALRERAALPASATPAEVVRALEPRVPPSVAPTLVELRERFEEADFSQAPVDARYYLTFARARRAVEEHLREETLAA